MNIFKLIKWCGDETEVTINQFANGKSSYQLATDIKMEIDEAKKHKYMINKNVKWDKIERINVTLDFDKNGKRCVNVWIGGLGRFFNDYTDYTTGRVSLRSYLHDQLELWCNWRFPFQVNIVD